MNPRRWAVLAMSLSGTVGFGSTGLAMSDDPAQIMRETVVSVLYHELAHALIREFELPVLGNEESIADSFSTIWISEQLRDEAPSIIQSRIRNWIYEDSQISPTEYDFKGEHPIDIRRAYQTACIFYGLDPAEFESYVEWLSFSERDLADCSDTAPHQSESWAKVLAPHILPEGDLSSKVQVIYGEGPLSESMQSSGLIEAFALDVAQFDWPELITVHFDRCDGGASWDREERRILLCDAYVDRLFRQSQAIVDME